MHNSTIHVQLERRGAPDDLYIVQGRLAEVGVRVRLPAPTAHFAPFDPPLPIDADEWAEDIVSARGRIRR